MTDERKWTYTPTIMDGAVVRYPFTSYCEINASRNGVSVCGTVPVMTSARLTIFKDLLSDAHDAHCEIKQNEHDGAKAWVEKQNRHIEALT